MTAPVGASEATTTPTNSRPGSPPPRSGPALGKSAPTRGQTSPRPQTDAGTNRARTPATALPEPRLSPRSQTARNQQQQQQKHQQKQQPKQQPQKPVRQTTLPLEKGKEKEKETVKSKATPKPTSGSGTLTISSPSRMQPRSPPPVTRRIPPFAAPVDETAPPAEEYARRASLILDNRPASSSEAAQALEASVRGIEQGGPWGYPPLRTDSDQSLGSLEHYNADWNSADEVSSASLAAPVGEHPAGNSACGRSIHDLQVAALRAAQNIDVSPILFTFMQYLI
jgi:hypothetical protein